MHDARDAEDTRLLEAGEFGLLVESYYGVIIDRCRVKVRNDAGAIDVAHDVSPGTGNDVWAQLRL